jgi:phosphatidylglycerol:prolipoprotein diacylglycerol transferase
MLMQIDRRNKYMNPEMFSIGAFSIRWYSFLILVGIFLGLIIATFEEKRKGFPKDFVIDLGFWLILAGIVGARAYYVLFNLDYYLKVPLQVFATWNGGLAIHGGIIGGLIALIIFCKKKNIEIIKACDLAVPSLIIAQAIGRWGNFFNSEAHGPLTTLAYLKDMNIPDFVIKGMYINGNYYIPTFYYESLWCILGFIILMVLRYILKKHNKGILTSIYLIWYGIGRVYIESLRTDSLMLGNIKIAQLVSILSIVIGLVMLIIFIIGYCKENKKEKY